MAEDKTTTTHDNPRLGVPEEELGMTLHTALRKCCDSKATSLLYNIITCDDVAVNDAWMAFLNNLWGCWMTQRPTTSRRR